MLLEIAAESEEVRARLLDLAAGGDAEAAAPVGAGGVDGGVDDGGDDGVAGGVATPRGKLRLFRELFRGRTDVFPVRFVSRKTGRAGYAPACGNKFVAGLCELPTVKCGACPNRAFLPVNDRTVGDHLRGRHVMGVYPLLEDETCWFLAADFDGPAWREDVAAFRETCAGAALPCAVERSRSGAGAHVWFFFASPVPAHLARKMGCHLLTETMARRHQLAMASYDRLFPNQDTMPRGGFGNLIALPLQREPRRHGNTLFLDEAFEPHGDQWAYLASVPRLAAGTVEAVATEATRRGLVVGVPGAAFHDDDEAAAPWARAPSRRTAARRVAGPLPPDVRAVFSQRIFVEKAGLPSALLNRIQRLAAFQNPDFYRKQALRLSTALTPRVITCAEELPAHVALPRGCLPDLEDLLADHGISLSLDDQRHAGEPLHVEFRGELTGLQARAAGALLPHDAGVFVAPPGVGKTVLGTYLVARRATSTLVVVHRRTLLEQWVAQLAMFLGLAEKEIGRIGGGTRRRGGRLDVAMIQSLVRKDRVADLVAEYGHVIVDECHHVPAVSFERVLSEVRARFVLGLTATPERRDGHHPILGMQLGPVRFAVGAGDDAAARPLRHRLLVRETGFRLDAARPDATIQEIYRELSRDEIRNRRILQDVVAAVGERRCPLLLTERRDHLELLADQLREAVGTVIVLRGGTGIKARRAALAQLAAAPADGGRVLLATGRYLGEGFDDARLDTLFLALPVSWKGTLTQYAGRLHRPHPAKTEVRIYDYVDRHVPMLARMFQKRLRAYRAMGYERQRAGAGVGGEAQEGLATGT